MASPRLLYTTHRYVVMYECILYMYVYRQKKMFLVKLKKWWCVVMGEVLMKLKYILNMILMRAWVFFFNGKWIRLFVFFLTVNREIFSFQFFNFSIKVFYLQALKKINKNSGCVRPFFGPSSIIQFPIIDNYPIQNCARKWLLYFFVISNPLWCVVHQYGLNADGDVEEKIVNYLMVECSFFWPRYMYPCGFVANWPIWWRQATYLRRYSEYKTEIRRIPRTEIMTQ